ncbi:MAG: type II secretion system protein GspL [Deltaproteobacteria bacterium]|nr:type II secretion system protein GspL [Deltaproteobacteria bacterium]
MSRKILGVDIGRNAVSAVLVRGGIKGNWIEDHRRVPISPDVSFEESLPSALNSVASEMDIEGATRIVAFPAEELSYRNIEAPFSDRKKLRQILPYELETNLPYPPEQIIIDFTVLKASADHDRHRVFVAAVQAEKVAFYLDLLKAQGMEPDVMSIGGYSLAQALVRFSDEKADRLLLAVEPGRAGIFLLSGEEICLVRSFGVTTGSEADIQGLCRTVQQTLAGFGMRSGLTCDVQEVFLTGSLFENPDMEKAVAAGLDLPVRSMDLIGMSGLVSIDTEGVPWRFSTMDAALSLALSDVVGLNLLNFRRGRFAVQKEWKAHKKDFLKTGLLAVLVLLLLVATFTVDYFSMETRSVQLNKEIRGIFSATFPDVTRIVDPLQQMRVKIKEIKEAETFSAEMGRPVKAIDILNTLSRNIPSRIDVQLVSVIIGTDSVLISGDTAGFDAVDDMKSSLEQAAMFKSVAISSTNKERTGNRVRFKIKATI